MNDSRRTEEGVKGRGGEWVKGSRERTEETRDYFNIARRAYGIVEDDVLNHFTS
jgi:hypothetical protein